MPRVTISDVSPKKVIGSTYYIRRTVAVSGTYQNPSGAVPISGIWLQPDQDPRPRGRVVPAGTGGVWVVPDYDTFIDPNQRMTDGPHVFVANGLDNTQAVVASSAPYPVNVDNMPPVINLKATSVPFSAQYKDAGSGIDVSTVRVVFDGQDVTNESVIDDQGVSFFANWVDLGEDHEFKVTAADLLGNSATVWVDAHRFDAESDDYDLRPVTGFGYTLPKSGVVIQRVKGLGTGGIVRTASTYHSAGEISDTWDGLDDSGNICGHDVYEVDVSFVEDDGTETVIAKIDPEGIAYWYTGLGATVNGSTSSQFYDWRYKIWCPTDGTIHITINGPANQLNWFVYKFGSRVLVDHGTTTGSPIVKQYEIDTARWYYIRIVSPQRAHVAFQISNSFNQYGDIAFGGAVRPPNFYWWPYTSDAKHEGFPLVTENTNVEGIVYGPLPKFDQYLHTTTVAQHNTAAPPGPIHPNPADSTSWWGHCDGGALMSILISRNQLPPIAQRVKGGVTFTVEDIKALYELCATFPTTFTETDSLDIDDHNGNFMKPNNNDPRCNVWVNQIHNELYNVIRKKCKPLMSDLGGQGTSTPQVWNHVIYRYNAEMTAYSPNFVDRYRVKVVTNLSSNRDHVPPTTDSGSRVDYYEYDMQYFLDGTIDKTWSGQKWKAVYSGSPTARVNGWMPAYMTNITGCNFDKHDHGTTGLTKAQVDAINH